MAVLERKPSRAMPYLIDKSALARMPHPMVQATLAPILEDGEAATCAMIDLEVLYSPRNADEHARARRRRAIASLTGNQLS